MEPKTANDDRDAPFADPFDLSDLSWGGQRQAKQVPDGLWNEGNVSAGINVEQLGHAPTPVNDNNTGDRATNGTKQVATLSMERELYLHSTQSTKVSA